MSAIQQFPDASIERRRAERLHIAGTVPVIFGRGGAVLIDLSKRGARIRHSAPVQRGTSVRIGFEWDRMRFSATGEVLAVRVISLGTGPSYESRIRFTAVDPGSEGVLAAAMDEIAGRDMRRWVANLHGWSDESQSPESRLASSFIRCRLRGAWWERKSTTDSEQPADGFLLPSESSESEIARLCDTYARASEDERRMIRMMAAASVEHATSVLTSRSLDGSTRRRGIVP